MSWDDAVWVVQPIDIAALLPVPSRWQRYDHQDFTCWQLDGERWLISVCDPGPSNPAEVPERVRERLPGGGLPDQHRPGTDQPITGRMGLPQRVITALATGSHGLGFDVFTDEPIH